MTFKAGESEITFAEGTSANATVEGDTTQAGTLALADGTALPGRAIRLSFVSGRIDSVFVDATGAADADVSGLTAVAVTGTDGGFSVKLDDPAGPEVVPDVPESPVINAIAEETLTDSTPLQGANGATDDTDANEPAPNPGYLNAEANLTVNFAAAPTVVAIEINDSTSDGDYAPGRPADLDVTVFAADGPDAGTAPDVDQRRRGHHRGGQGLPERRHGRDRGRPRPRRRAQHAGWPVGLLQEQRHLGHQQHR